MKILLYTSINPNQVDRYNIFRLINENPEHEYFLIAVNKEIKSTGPSGRKYIAYFINRIISGKDVWFEDNKRVHDKIAELIKVDYLKKNSIILVPSVNGKIAENEINKIKPDLILQCGAGILKKNIFSQARIGTINVHHGYAPEVRGVSSIFWAMCYGLPIGVTVHFIDSGLDTGAVICQHEYMNSKDRKYEDVYYEMIKMGGSLLANNTLPLLSRTTFKSSQSSSYYFSNVENKFYKKFKKYPLKFLSGKESLKFKIVEKKKLMHDE